MRLADYHLHSEFSFDSREKIENICEKAIGEGISEIVLTDHCEFPKSDNYPWPDFERRNEILAECRKKYGDGLSILSGVELGQAWRDCPLLDSLLAENNFDYCIGSIHCLDGILDLGKADINDSNFHKHFDEYIEQMIRIVESTDFDCMGHITYLFKLLSPEFIAEHPPESYKEQYMPLLDAIASHGKGIEINCSGLRMAGLKSTMPSETIVSWFRQCGGKTVTVGSDGHSCRSAFSGLEEGYNVLRWAGFGKVARFRGREVYYLDI